MGRVGELDFMGRYVRQDWEVITEVKKGNRREQGYFLFNFVLNNFVVCYTNCFWF